MQLVAEEVNALRGAIAEVRSFGEITIPAHPAAFATGDTAHLYRFGVYTEVVLASVYLFGQTAAYFLLKTTYCLAAVIELTA